MSSQFQPTIITGKWRSGTAGAQLGPWTKMAMVAGNGWLNLPRIVPVKSQLWYRHLKQKFVASRCRSSAGDQVDTAAISRNEVSHVEAARLLAKTFGVPAGRNIYSSKTQYRIFCSHHHAGGSETAQEPPKAIVVNRAPRDKGATVAPSKVGAERLSIEEMGFRDRRQRRDG